MGDQDDGAAAHKPLDYVDERRLLRLLVDWTRRLVQDEHRAVLQERPRNGDALVLATGERDPSLPHLGVVTVGKPDDEVVSVRRPRRRDELSVAGLRPGASDVLGDAGREQHRV